MGQYRIKRDRMNAVRVYHTSIKGKPDIIAERKNITDEDIIQYKAKVQVQYMSSISLMGETWGGIPGCLTILFKDREYRRLSESSSYDFLLKIEEMLKIENSDEICQMIGNYILEGDNVGSGSTKLQIFI